MIAADLDTIQIGDARVTAISDGTLPWHPRYSAPDDEYRLACPDADAEGRLPLGLNSFHIALGDASVIVDPCDWNDEMRGYFPAYVPAAGLMAGLAALGVEADAVTHVLVTHGHADHFNGIAGLRFPNATHYVGLGDWSDAFEYRSHPLYDSSFGEAQRQGVLRTVADETEVAPGITLAPAPGESAGHCVIRIDSRGGSCWLLGDLVHHAVEFERPEWITDAPQRLPDLMRATRERLYPVLADRGDVAAFAHEPFAPWGRVVRAGGGYRWERLAR